MYVCHSKFGELSCRLISQTNHNCYFKEEKVILQEHLVFLLLHILNTPLLLRHRIDFQQFSHKTFAVHTIPWGPTERNTEREFLMIFAEYNQQDAKFHNLFTSVTCSTCFRRFFRPSPGAQNCTYRVRYWSDKYLTLYVQFWSPDDGRKNLLKHVDRLTEINKLWNVASCWLYSENILTMHGPTNVKFLIICQIMSIADRKCFVTLRRKRISCHVCPFVP